MHIKEIYDTTRSFPTLTATEGEFLINTPDSDLPELMKYAKLLREEYLGDEAALCSIINARSGHCSENCSYCAQSAHHKTNASVYDLVSEEKMIAAAEASVKNGSGCFCIVTSGKGASKDFDKVVSAVKKISAKGIKISASLGILSLEQALELKAAGLHKFHHNIETAKSFFPEMCSTHSYEDRIRTIQNAKAADLKVCCGGIFGIGETPAQRVEFGIELRDLGVDSIPINILHQIPGTKLHGKVEPMSVNDVLRLIATFRFLMPDKEIGIMGGRQSNLKERQGEIFEAGANGIMIGDYLTTKGSDVAEDLKMVEKAGLAVAGHFAQ